MFPFVQTTVQCELSIFHPFVYPAYRPPSPEPSFVASEASQEIEASKSKMKEVEAYVKEKVGSNLMSQEEAEKLLSKVNGLVSQGWKDVEGLISGTQAQNPDSPD